MSPLFSSSLRLSLSSLPFLALFPMLPYFLPITLSSCLSLPVPSNCSITSTPGSRLFSHDSLLAAVIRNDAVAVADRARPLRLQLRTGRSVGGPRRLSWFLTPAVPGCYACSGSGSAGGSAGVHPCVPFQYIHERQKLLASGTLAVYFKVLSGLREIRLPPTGPAALPPPVHRRPPAVTDPCSLPPPLTSHL